MENKNKNHISEIALGEFATAFAFVLFLVVFSPASAENGQPIPTLPQDGYQTLQIPRPDVSILTGNGGDYFLQDHLSWNPINNLNAINNWTSWNILGSYTEKMNGMDYTFKKMGNGGVQASYKDPDNEADVTLSRDSSGVTRYTETGKQGEYTTTDFPDGGSIRSYVPKEGADGFVRTDYPGGRSTIDTIDSATGTQKTATYDSAGILDNESYRFPAKTLEDGTTAQLVMRSPEGNYSTLSEPPATFTDEAGRKWNSTVETKDNAGNIIDKSQLAYDQNEDRWYLENPDIYKQTLVQPDPTKPSSGLAVDLLTGETSEIKPPPPPPDTSNDAPPAMGNDSAKNNSGVDAPDAMSNNTTENNPGGGVDYNKQAEQNSQAIAKENDYQPSDREQEIYNVLQDSLDKKQAEQWTKNWMDGNPNPAEEEEEEETSKNQQPAQENSSQPSSLNNLDYSNLKDIQGEPNSYSDQGDNEPASGAVPPVNQENADLNTFVNNLGLGQSQEDLLAGIHFDNPPQEFSLPTDDNGGGASSGSDGGSDDSSSSGGGYDYGSYDSGE